MMSIMNDNIPIPKTLEEAVLFITTTLGCSIRRISSYIGVPEQEIVSNMGKEASDIARFKVGSRIFSLYAILNSISGGSFSKSELHEILNVHSFSDIDGNFDSIVSILHQDKYSTDTMLNVSKISTKLIQKQKFKD